MLRKLLPAFLLPKLDKPTDSSEPEHDHQDAIAFNRKYVYSTEFGQVTVTWSRSGFKDPSICTVVGFSLQPGNKERANSTTTTTFVPADTAQEFLYQPFSFTVNPEKPRQAKGVKRFVVLKKKLDCLTEPICCTCFAWDFSNALYGVIAGSVEPSSGFYFAVAMDGEMVILFGDMPERAYEVTRARPACRPGAILTRREDRARLKGLEYNTSVAFGGVRREVSIYITRGVHALMYVEIDGRRAVAVQSVFKSFRGTAKFDLSDGRLIQITWDLHDWIFGHHDITDKSDDDGSDDDSDVSTEEEELTVYDKEDGIFTFSFVEQDQVNTAQNTSTEKYLDVMCSGQWLPWWRMVEAWVSSEEERMHKGETFCYRVYIWKS